MTHVRVPTAAWSPRSSTSRLARQGRAFGSLDELAREHSDLVERHLFSVFDPSYDRFAALHAAAWSGGTFLYVPKGVVDRSAAAHADDDQRRRRRFVSHLLVVLDEGAEATLLSETAGGGETASTAGRSS